MTADTTTIHSLFERLLRAIIDKPSCLEIQAEEMAGRVNWSVTVDIDDQGKVIGKQGSHIKALQYLLARIGIRYGMRYMLAVTEPKQGERGPLNPPRKVNSYDTRNAEGLLWDIVGEVLQGDFVELDIAETPIALPNDRLSFMFRIKPRTSEALNGLTMAGDPIGNGNAQTVESALGTLFRAYGLAEGVKFHLEVVKPL